MVKLRQAALTIGKPHKRQICKARRAAVLRTAEAFSRYASRKSGPYSQSITVDAGGAFVRVDQMAEETTAQGAIVVVGAAGGSVPGARKAQYELRRKLCR